MSNQPWRLASRARVRLLPRLCVIVCFCALAFQTRSPVVADDGGTETQFGPWVRLFDGQSMSEWEGDESYFRVEDGCIVAGTLEKKIPHNQFLCTKKRYTDFELTLEAKLVGEGDNAGVQFRSKRIPDTTEVSGYQADAGSAWNRSVWGALYDESRRRKMLAEPPAELGEKLVRVGDWNELRVLCEGNTIRIFVNGKQTVHYVEEDPSIPREGVFALQIHSGPPSEAWYRNIRVRERKMPDQPKTSSD